MTTSKPHITHLLQQLKLTAHYMIFTDTVSGSKMSGSTNSFLAGCTRTHTSQVVNRCNANSQLTYIPRTSNSLEYSASDGET